MSYEEAIALLKELIAIPSFSRDEVKTADVLMHFFTQKGVSALRKGNNLWCRNLYFDEDKPTLLLNSHHDTVQPNQGYTKDPFDPIVEEGKLFGLGSNDAGASLVSLLVTFMHFYPLEGLPYNLIYAASAEEEVSGKDGIASIIQELGSIDLAIVGEPTQMQMAIAEKGLMVLDCYVHGKAGHAAGNEGENAIYKALDSIRWFQTYEFEKVSESFGPVKMTVTQINAGTQHNVVPDLCSFVVDLRSTDVYDNEELLSLIRSSVDCGVKARSTRLNPSGISKDHPMVKAGQRLGMTTYGSPTLSDQALMPFPSIKIGPGDSARSHTVDEFIYLKEIEEGIAIYIKLIQTFFKILRS